ncbi:MAG: polysaccharide biosynthesis tyrosine autokinase [Planctomycetota bacterium]
MAKNVGKPSELGPLESIQAETPNSGTSTPPPDVVMHTGNEYGTRAIGHDPHSNPAVESGTAQSMGAVWQRSKWWLVGALSATGILVVPAIWLFTTPVYRATALVRVSPKSVRMAFKNEDNSSSSLYRTYVNTQVAILRGSTVLQRVLDQPAVRETRWYQNRPKGFLGAAPSHLERLMSALSVRPHRDSELIEVSVEVERAVDAKTMANVVAEEYKKFSDESLRETDVQRYDTLTEEHTRLQREIDGLIKTKFSIAKQLGTASPEELRSQLSTHLGRLEEQYSQLARQLATVKADLAWLSAQESGARAENSNATTLERTLSEAELRYAHDVDWRRLQFGLKELEHQLEVARQNFGDSHPKIRQLQSDVEHAGRLVVERAAQIDESGPLVGPQGSADGAGVFDRGSLERQSERFQQQMTLLREEIEQQRIKVAHAGDLAGDLAQYDEQIHRKRQLCETLFSRLTELELEGKAPARITVEVHATEPSQAAKDRRLLWSLLALLAAVTTGAGMGYARAMLDPRITEAVEVRQTMGVPFLGQIPALPLTKDIMDGCTPFLLESVRIVRTALVERLQPVGRGTVLITSTTSQTGKTSLAVLLGASLAAMGKKTLLVEADLRRPSMAERLGLSSKLGLASLLMDACGALEVTQASRIRGLDVVLAGDVPEEFDAEHLANGRFKVALTAWSDSYDFILVDSPPVLPVADARILAKIVDGTIVVLKSSHTRRADVVQAYADLMATGCRLLGTVLVGTQSTRGYGYDAAYYGYTRPKKQLVLASAS